MTTKPVKNSRITQNQNAQLDALFYIDNVAADTALNQVGEEKNGAVTEAQGVTVAASDDLLHEADESVTKRYAYASETTANESDSIFKAQVENFFGDPGGVVTDDTLVGTDGEDEMVGDLGNDYIDGGLGDDVIWGDGHYDDEDNLDKTVGGNDTLLGGEGADQIIGGVGDDFIDGGAGDDTLWGDEGNDEIYGGDGNDSIVGGSGTDTIDAGAGNDNVWAGAGADQVVGGAGDDKIRGEDDGDTIDGGDGNDVIWGDSYSLDDSLHGNDNILGGADNDLISGGGGNDTIDGGDGDDFIWGDEAGSYGTIHGNDTLTGGAGNDYIMGEGGNDIIYGGAGNDTLRGDASYLASTLHGNDELYGGDGNDKLMGGAGDDLLVGGTGINEYQFSKGSGNDRIVLTAGATDTIQLGTGITPADVTFIREYTPLATDPTQGYSNDFTINFVGTSSSILFEDLFTLSYANVIGEIRFADGTVILYDEFTNSAPIVANAIEDFIVLEDSALNLDVSTGVFFDIDSDALTLTVTSPDGALLFDWLTFDGSTFTGTPLNEHVGVYSITLSAFDGYETVSTSFQLTVENTNDAPVVAAPIADKSATQDTAFSFTVSAAAFTDVDVGDVLTLSATLADDTALPAWLTFNSATRTFSGTPGNADVGTLNVKVTATDIEGATVSDTFALEVLNTNDTPEVGAGVGDVLANEDALFAYVIPTDAFTDVDGGDVLTYTATLADLSALPAWLSFNGTTGEFTGTPLNEHVGILDILVTATDTTGASATDNFTLEVMNTNDAPVVDAGLANLSTLQSSPFAFTIPADAFDDVDAGDVLSYTAALAGGGALPTWLTLNSTTGAFSGTPGNSDVGVLNINVTARDTAGATVVESFSLEIININDAPTVSAGITNVSVAENTALSKTFAANAFVDVDGDTLTYTATLADGSALPAWLTFNAATRTFSGTPGATEIGTTTITVGASDGEFTAFTNFSIEVGNVNDAPTVANIVPDQAVNEDAAFSFQFAANTFADLDGDTLTYTSNAAGWLSFNAATRTFSGTPLNADVGTTVVTLTANDGNGGSVSDTFNIVVANVNDAPEVDAGIPNLDVTAGVPLSYIVPANAFKDVDGDTLSYTAAVLDDFSALPAWLSFDDSTGTFTGTPDANAEGLVILVGVTDGEFIASADFTLI
ncbi:MAG: putative Ig domain-containing protein [Hahellaceae bacterium]|nr:putative Ig domain-containing protein [Hahellaceae bacterium]